jgi:hypothetical protein
VRPTARQALRGVGLGRVAVGLLTLTAIRRDDVPLPRRARGAARVLAARDLAQGTALAFAPERYVARVVRVADTVDLLHAASMLPLVLLSRRYRSPAATSAASAVTWVGLNKLATRG